MGVVTAFYLHALRHMGRSIGPVDSRDAQPDALALLERAYADRGGLGAALSQATSGLDGGLRSMLDRLADYMKAEECEKHLIRVLRERVDPQDWPRKEALMSAWLKRHADVLPPDISQAPAARFAQAYEPILRVHSDAVKRMRQLLRSL